MKETSIWRLASEVVVAEWKNWKDKTRKDKIKKDKTGKDKIKKVEDEIWREKGFKETKAEGRGRETKTKKLRPSKNSWKIKI